MRTRLRETFHGTGVGQLRFPDALRDRFDLSERETVVATLLTQGCSQKEISVRLGITSSTAAKHLAQVRRKLGAETTSRAALLLVNLVSESMPPSVHSTSTRQSVAGSSLRASDRMFAERLAGAPNLDHLLNVLLDHLSPFGVGGLFYSFLPLGVASFRNGDQIECHIAPKAAVDAYLAAGGMAGNPIAHRIFSDPDSVVLIDGKDAAWRAGEESDGIDDALIDVLLACGFRYSIALGSPFGPGFVGISVFLAEAEGDEPPGLEDERIEEIRSGLLVAQNAAFSFGALAGTLGLTVRERDVLSQIGAGQSTGEAALELKMSERALSDHVRSARGKLRARTTSEAICKATALNALVFL